MKQAKKKGKLSAENLYQIAELFRALGEPMRLRILQTNCNKEGRVNDIVEITGANQANVSKHLSLLTTTGILGRRKDGQRVFYGVKEPFAVKLCELVRSEWLE